MKKKYKVTVQRTEFYELDIVVKAGSMRQAQDKALDQTGDLNFHDGRASNAIETVTWIEELS
jgi:hypothetical protein